MANNTPIVDLIADYEDNGCDFSDTEFLVRASYRNVQTMADSQVRCLLFAMAQQLEKSVVVSPPYVPEQANPNIEEARSILVRALELTRADIGDGSIQYSTSVRKTKTKKGDVRNKLYLKVESFLSRANTFGVLSRILHEELARSGAPFKVKLYTTSSTFNDFTARLVVEGDHDFEQWMK